MQNIRIPIINCYNYMLEIKILQHYKNEKFNVVI